MRLVNGSRRHRRAYSFHLRLWTSCQFGETEIENFGLPALGNEQIGGLKIAVNDTCRMRDVERVGDLPRSF